MVLACVGCGSSSDGGGGDDGPTLGATIARVTLSDTRASGEPQSDVFATFGHVFVRGDVPAGTTLVGRAADGTTVPLQVDAKATYPDGSLRHAVLTARVPQLTVGEPLPVDLVSASPSDDSALDIASLAQSAFDAEVRITIGGTTYSASAKPLLAAATSQWLHGPLTTEVSLSAPLKDAGGTAHPHLAARFNIRMLGGGDRARVDVIVENVWAYAPAPQNYTYDLSILVGGTEAYAKAGVTHLAHARWRETVYWGAAPTVYVAEDTAYLIKSGALPNYDPTVVPDEAKLVKMGELPDPPWDPMQIGVAVPYMPQTGGRADIGLVPGWGALYVISMDPRAAKAMLMTADGAGSWPIHYRDQTTNLPVSLIDHAYMTLLGNPGDAVNPQTMMSDAFPACGGDCSSPYTPDSAHEPSLVYVPYLVTGDHYYLEELQFWANYNMFRSNPYYRGFEKGLLNSDQVRGQAWSLRTLGEVAAFTPDDDPLKAYFVDRVGFNLEHYNMAYGAGGPQHNDLGIVEDGAFAYQNGRGVAAWQDDFFTSAVGHLVELGWDDAKPLLAFKATTPVGRMVGDGYCWISATEYEFIVRDSSMAALYTTFAQVYAATADPSVVNLECNSQAMADALSLKVGEMVGYSSSATGYPSNMQPALAMSVDAGAPKAADAWAVFAGRSVKPLDYGAEPQFAIVPR